MVLDRYIARSIFTGSLIAMLVLLSIFMLTDFVAQLKHIGTGDYNNWRALVYVLLQLPQRFYELSPSILLLGSIISLGTMAANSELIVMRAAGVSIYRITRSVLQAGLVIAIAVALTGEYVVPYTTGMAKTLRAEAMDQKLIVGGYHDVWARDGNRYINIKQIMPDHQLHQISIYVLDSHRHLKAMIYADKARYENNHWVVSGVKRTDISRARGTAAPLPQTRVSYRQTMTMPGLILPELFTVLELEAQDMSAQELYTYSRYLEANHLDDGEYRLAFWIKIFTPLTCLAMLLISMPLVFLTTPRSGGSGQRIVVAIVIGIAFFVFSRTSNYLGLALGVMPFISAVLPLILVISISFFFLRRINH